MSDRQEYHVEGTADPISHYCDAVRTGDLLFVSGVPALLPDGTLAPGDVVAQFAQVLENLDRVLRAAGCSAADVVKVNVYLTDVDERPLINPLRQAFFGETRPASTLVGVASLPVPGMRVEMEAVARVPGPRN